MPEVLFYHLSTSRLDATLPELLTRALSRDWRVVVRAGSDGAVAALDDWLWHYRDDSFLPHGTASGPHPDRQPVYLTTGTENPAGASVLMLVEGARVAPAEAAAYDRLCLIFDGADEGALQSARADWVAVRDAGLKGTYWAQDGGKWVERAST